MYKKVLLVFLIFTAFICFFVISISNGFGKAQSKRKEFTELLNMTSYYYVGRVKKIQRLDKNAGFICLEAISFNEEATKKLFFNNQIVSMIDDRGCIFQLDVVLFLDENSNRLVVEPGDIVKYNVNNSAQYQVLRNKKLIYEDHAIIDNPRLQKEFLKFVHSTNCN